MAYLAAAEGKTNVLGLAEDKKREREIERVRALRVDKDAFVR